MDKKKVLVVDDEKDFLMILKLNLEQSGGYEVCSMPSAKDIVKRTQDFKPDIILMDVMMPEVDGIQACKMLNEDSYCSNIPIIIISALREDSDKLKAYKQGVVDYVTKPIEVNNLIAKIEKAIRFK